MIGAEVGQAPASVQYWKNADHWDRKLADIAKIDSAGDDARKVRAILFRDLAEHISALSGLIRVTQSEKMKITAIQAFVGLAAKLHGILPGEDATFIPPAFHDDIAPTTEEPE